MINIQPNSSCKPACRVEWALGFPTPATPPAHESRWSNEVDGPMFRCAIAEGVWLLSCVLSCVWKGQMPPNAEVKMMIHHEIAWDSLVVPNLKSGKSVATCPAFEDSRSTLRPGGVMDSAREVVGHFSRKSKDGTECYPFTCREGYVYWEYPPMSASV